MSKVKKLADVFKASAEVASLESTDRVLAVGSDGNTKKLQPYMRCFFEQNKWYRLGINEDTGAATSVLLNICTNWNKIVPITALLSIAVSASVWNAAKNHSIKVLNCSSQTVPFKIRIICANTGSNNVYVDIMNTEDNPRFYIDVISTINFDLSITADATIPDGHVAYEKTLTFTPECGENSGGVKRFPLILYAISQKGGLRNGRSKKDYKRVPETNYGGCVSTQKRVNVKYRRNCFSGYVSHLFEFYRDIPSKHWRREVRYAYSVSQAQRYRVPDDYRREWTVCGKDILQWQMERVATATASDEVTRKEVAA